MDFLSCYSLNKGYIFNICLVTLPGRLKKSIHVWVLVFCLFGGEFFLSFFFYCFKLNMCTVGLFIGITLIDFVEYLQKCIYRRMGLLCLCGNRNQSHRTSALGYLRYRNIENYCYR